MAQDYSSHGIIFSRDLVNIAIVDDPGHAGKQPGLTLPGGRPKSKDKNNPLDTFYREVRMETGIAKTKLELLGVIRDGREVIIPGDTDRGVPPKTVLQYVYLARALSGGISDLKISGETNGWFWAPFDLRNPPEANGKRLYATYRILWQDDVFLSMVEPLYHKSWELWYNRRAAHK